ncbi:MAG: SIS domain-containing protein [bacterium]
MEKKAKEFLASTKTAVNKLEIDQVVGLSRKIKSSLSKGGKLIAFGNGGSAADAQHLVAELVVRFEKDRAPISAIALTTNTSVLTAAGNDFGFEEIFSKQIEALACKDDVVVALSTSGTSPNILKGVAAAKEKECFTVGFTGKSGGKLKSITDLCISIDSSRTADIQVCHIALLHLLCFLIESD